MTTQYEHMMHPLFLFHSIVVFLDLVLIVIHLGRFGILVERIVSTEEENIPFRSTHQSNYQPLHVRCNVFPLIV